MTYVPYHMHTIYSIADGIATTERYLDYYSDINALAITDHGNCYGWVEHTKVCKEYNIKPIIGIEAYILHNDPKDMSHLVIIVLNKTGYNNLLYLVKESYKYKYYKPRILYTDLLKNNDGLLITTACRGGILAKPFLSGDKTEALERYKLYRSAFGNRFKGEIQPAYEENQQKLNEFIFELFEPDNIYCATDSHYVTPDDHKLHSLVKDELLMPTKRKDAPSRAYENYYYLWTYDQLINYKGIPRFAIDNTNQLLELVKFELTLDKPFMPHLDLPDGYTEHSKLCELVYLNMPKLIPYCDKRYYKRLDYELSVIRANGTAPYFLLNYNIFREFRSRGILYGPRGSACGSLVAYCLQLHDIDPIKHNIMFERFMTPGRKSLPDIDYDFYNADRDRAFKIVENMYGKENVARIATFQRLKLKSTIQVVGKTFEIDTKDIKKLSGKASDVSSYDELLAKTDLPLELANKSADYKRWIEYIKIISERNIPKNDGLHACGCVITSQPTHKLWPIMIRDGLTAVQYDMDSIEAAGGVKMDFLGLSSLYSIRTGLNMLGLKTADILTDDQAVYNFIVKDSMVGLFQAKNRMMKKLIRDMKPQNLNDLAAAVASFRPAVLKHGLDQLYIKRKNGEEPVDYIHPDLESVLKHTYGIFLYQDNVLGACRAIGMTDLEADKVRKALGKKKHDVVVKLKELFYKKAEQKGWSADVINRIWEILESGTSYGFNYSHALTYGRWLYISAWFKYYYPGTFYSESLTARQTATMSEDEGDLFRALLNDCKKHMQLIAPDINKSYHRFIYQQETNSILYSLSAVKSIGYDKAKWLIRHRPFKSMHDLLEKAGKYKEVYGYIDYTDKFLQTYNKWLDKHTGKTFKDYKLTKARYKQLHLSNEYKHIMFASVVCSGSWFAYKAYKMFCTVRARNAITLGHLEALIFSGALDSIGDRQKMLYELFIMRCAKGNYSKNIFFGAKGKENLNYFLLYKDKSDDVSQEHYDEILKLYNSYCELSAEYLMKKQYEYCGYNETNYGGDNFYDAEQYDDLTINGLITTVKMNKKTVHNKTYHMFVFNTDYGDIMCYIFNNANKYNEEILKKNNMVTVTGYKNIHKYSDRKMLNVKKIEPLILQNNK